MSNASTARRPGFALEATLMVLTLFTALIGAAILAVTGLQRTTSVDYGTSYVTYAAEAGSDAVMNRLAIAASAKGWVSAADLDSISPANTAPVIPGVMFDTMTASLAGAPAFKPITKGTFAGLYATVQPYDVRIVARDAQQNSAKAVVTVTTAAMPLFQFGVFFEGDLEINPGPQMTFAGWVHSNDNIYLYPGNTLRFESLITTPDSVFRCRKDAVVTCRTGGPVQVNNAVGTPVTMNQDSRSLPAFAAFRTWSTTSFNARVQTNAFGVSPLRLPIPQSVDPIVIIDTMRATDSDDVRKVKYAWKADWHLTVDLADADPTAALCAAMAAPSLASGTFRRTPGDLESPGINTSYQMPAVNGSAVSCDSIFVFRANRFGESREQRGVDALDIDVRRLRQWIAADSASRWTQIMYVTFRNANLTMAARDFPAVRLHGADSLPGPKFTLATDRPIYTRGNFNVDVGTNWKPASLVGDAVTFLGSNWGDSVAFNPANNGNCTNNRNNCNPLRTSLAQTGSADTLVINAAVAAGNVPTTCDAARTGCAGPAYSGGLENFPRFLQDWGGRVVRYRGSLVCLYPSRYANGAWIAPGATSRTYGAPVRDWAFDLRFRLPQNQPAGAPIVATVAQIAYRPVY